MRTTVTLDPDVEVQLKAAARRRGLGFKQALNDALREGLRAQERAQRGDVAFRQRSFRLGAPLVDLTKANQLADEAGDAEVAAHWPAPR